MFTRITAVAILTVALAVPSAFSKEQSKADLEIELTIKTFQESDQTEPFFKDAYGYAIFPTIGKGGMGIGGARGKGRVYAEGKYIGDTTVTQLSIGFQFGGQAFSQIIFFQNKAALNKFISGNFEFGAQVSAVALNVGAQASAGTDGASAGASTGGGSAHAKEEYDMGMAVFTVAKGGLMYEAAIGGQKFKYHALD